MESGVLMADRAIDPEMLTSVTELEINVMLRRIPVAVTNNRPAQPGPSRAYTKRHGRTDYVDKKPHENGEGRAGVRVNSVVAKVTTSMM